MCCVVCLFACRSGTHQVMSLLRTHKVCAGGVTVRWDFCFQIVLQTFDTSDINFIAVVCSEEDESSLKKSSLCSVSI